ncbi:MAG: DsrE/DsrF/DrsH-like family protein [Planctomycetales bacterium]|nr:DsrE/DsrF/DrsH-like family protein [Planctomycetales bacterium]
MSHSTLTPCPAISSDESADPPGRSEAALDFERRFGEIEELLANAVHLSQQANDAAPADRATIVAFSGDMDKLMAAFIIATGAAAMGMEVCLFFTFWGLAAVKKQTLYRGKGILERLMAAMLPSGPHRLSTSKMNFLGAGPTFFKTVMRRKNVTSLPELVELAQELDVKMVACEMSMGVMGVTREEMIEGLEYGGVAAYLGDAAQSKVTLFI